MLMEKGLERIYKIIVRGQWKSEVSGRSEDLGKWEAAWAKEAGKGVCWRFVLPQM